ncbi:hypothetical protein Tco_0356868 [Tanacetum coccineum]
MPFGLPMNGDFHGVNEAGERKRRVREAFSNNVKRHQRGKLSRCRWNHMGNEPILALRKDAVRFVVYYDSAKQEFGACWEKEEREEEEKGDCLPSTIWERQNIVVVPWNRIKEVKPRMSSSRFTTIDSSFENKDVGGISRGPPLGGCKDLGFEEAYKIKVILSLLEQKIRCYRLHMCGFRFTYRWFEYRGSSGLLLQPELLE